MRAYCAFCSRERRIHRKKGNPLVQFLSSFLMSGFLMFALWGKFHPLFFVFFVSFLILMEFFIRLRWRLSLICQSCGFDPIIYKRDPARAAQEVKIYMERRKAEPSYLLREPLNLPVTPPRGKPLVSRPKNIEVDAR